MRERGEDGEGGEDARTGVDVKVRSDGLEREDCGWLGIEMWYSTACILADLTE